MVWGLTCRLLLDDCTARTFLDLRVLVPVGIVSVMLSLGAGWLVGRRIYRATGSRPEKASYR